MSAFGNEEYEMNEMSDLMYSMAEKYGRAMALAKALHVLYSFAETDED